jgi:GTP-binding protein HflX
LFDRPSAGSDALLVALDFGERDCRERLAELRELARSAGLRPAGTIEGRRNRPDPAWFVGGGKADEIALALAAQRAALVLFDHELTAVQQRNLEQRLQCRVIDRTTLILDIFAQRARSHEGKLQVELAQLEHLSTRLVRGWTHLERQKGGIGLRGPGETQLETDRRLIGKRVKRLRDQLARLRTQRDTRRRARERGAVPSVSLVGYTNAGKSTLFNALTHAGTYAADQLFATLDTTSRRFYTPGGQSIVLSDTVGFIRDLPHSLVAAFRATLEETVRADLLLHVVDAASPDRDRQIEEVGKVLAEIGAEHIPQLLVYNKSDLTGQSPRVARDEHARLLRIDLSARSGAGIELLRAAFDELLAPAPGHTGPVRCQPGSALPGPAAGAGVPVPLPPALSLPA